VASVAALTGRRVGVAIGTSSEVVVRDWHSRSRRRAALALAESAVSLRGILDGKRSTLDGEVLRSMEYRLRLPAPESPLTVAAFGEAAVEVAARHADRLVLNLVSPATAAALVWKLRATAAKFDRPAPAVAVWVPAAAEPDPAAVEQLRRAVVGYLAAPGYAEMFTAEGFGDVVELAATRLHPRELLAAVGEDLVAAVGLLGSPADVSGRLAAYAEAGVDEVVLVPSCTDRDPAGARTLEAFACGG
jgi:probable F420-dependent oxidoreductase